MNYRQQKWAWITAGLGTAAFVVASFLFFDRPVAEWMRSQPEAWRHAATVFSKWGKAEYWVLAPALLCMLIYGCIRKNRANFFRALFVVLAAGGSGLINTTFKFGFGRARPPGRGVTAEEYGFHWFEGAKSAWQSFPSGHTIVVAAAATALWFVFPRLRPLCVLYVAMMMTARVLAGAHYPADVAAGAFLGAALTTLLWKTVFLDRITGFSGSTEWRRLL